MTTNAQTMAWMMDERGKRCGHNPACVTGKPVELGGSLGSEAATGRGGVFAAIEHAKRTGTPLENARVAIQGFGNVGSWTARLIADAAARVVQLAGHGAAT